MHQLYRISPQLMAVSVTGWFAVAMILLTAAAVPATDRMAFFTFFERRVDIWSPASVAATVAPGETQTIPLSLTTPWQLRNVVVYIPPALRPFVRVEPAEFPLIAKDTTVNLNLTLSVSPEALPGTIEGTLRLFSVLRVGGIRILFLPIFFAKTLPVEVIIPVVPLPPDPGEAGKATLEGIDSDRDGVRDDVQRYIVLTYQDSEKTRAALMQVAKKKQAVLLNANDKGSSIISIRENMYANECLIYIKGIDNAFHIIDEIKAEILNTWERSKAWIHAAQNFSGEFFFSTPVEDIKSRCEFDPDTMEN